MIAPFRRGRGEPGFTLVEVITTLAITAIIGTALTTSSIQVFQLSSRNRAHIIAVKEVENCTHWLTRDIQMTQTPTNGVSSFPITLEWTEWDGTTHEVTYSRAGTSFQRAESINGATATLTTLAANITTATCSLTSNVFTVALTSTIQVGGQTAAETRTTKIALRSFGT